MSKLLRGMLACYGIAGMCMSAGAQTVAFNWAKQFEGFNQDEYAIGNAIALDANRNIYTVGTFSGTVDFNPATANHYMTSAGGMYFNIFVSKLDKEGNFIWAKQMGGVSGSEGNAIALDHNGNVYSTGYYMDTVDFDPGPGVYKLGIGAGEGSAFVSKLDSAGNFVWAKRIGDGGWEVGNSIITDQAGNVYVSGQFDGTVDFDPGAGVSNLTAAGDADVFILKLSAAGDFVWVKSLGGANGNIENKALTLDRQGNIYSTGTFSGTLDFDPGMGTQNLTSSGWNSIFISKLNASGQYVWAKKIGGNYGSSGNAIAIDDNDNVITSGYFSSTVDFDPGTGVSNLVSSGPGIDFDVFVSKLDSAGNYKWAKRLGGTSFEDSKGLSLDRRGNIYTTGYFSGTADFDPGTGSFSLTAAGADVFISKLDSTGTFVWAKQIIRGMPDNNALGKSIVVDGSSNIYTSGAFMGAADFDPDAGLFSMNAGPLYSDDAFIHKMICIDTTSSQLTVTLDSCVSYSLNGFTYTQSGTYIQTIPNTAGCDSTITLHLTIPGNMNIVIGVNNFVLSATGSYTGYQWLKDNNIITGATGSTYTVTANGLYSLIATNALGCTDTSNILNINNTSIDDVPGIADLITVYPNPASDVIRVNTPVAVSLVLTSIEGKVIRKAGGKYMNVADMAEGLYMLRIYNHAGTLLKVEKIVKHK